MNSGSRKLWSMGCAFKVDSKERDGVLRVEDAELDEEIPFESSGGSVSIEDVVDVEDGEGLFPGRKYCYQDRGRGQIKTRLTEETILPDKHKGPRSSYASNRTPSTHRRLFFVLLLLLLLTGTTTLDSRLRFPRLLAVNVMKMEVSVLGLLKQTSALWV